MDTQPIVARPSNKSTGSSSSRSSIKPRTISSPDTEHTDTTTISSHAAAPSAEASAGKTTVTSTSPVYMPAWTVVYAGQIRTDGTVLVVDLELVVLNEPAPLLCLITQGV